MGERIDTSAARERILARLRAARATGYLPAPPDPSPPRRAIEHASARELLRRFGSELAALGVQVHREPTADAVAERVCELLEGRPALSWARDALPYDLGKRLADVELVEPGAARELAAACQVGLSGVHAAIAETGSLVCLSTPATPRTASLLPPRHVAVVEPRQVVPSMQRFLADRASYPAASAVNVITGPSRTADIELELIVGVHGPGVVTVVLGPND